MGGNNEQKDGITHEIASLGEKPPYAEASTLLCTVSVKSSLFSANCLDMADIDSFITTDSVMEGVGDKALLGSPGKDTLSSILVLCLT